MASRYWIQEAIEKPGALRSYVKRRFSKRGFTDKGTIKVSILYKLKRSKNPTIRKRASLALTLRRMNKKRHRKKKKRRRR